MLQREQSQNLGSTVRREEGDSWAIQCLELVISANFSMAEILPLSSCVILDEFLNLTDIFLIC